jgi:hypothetical protein
MKLPKIHGSVRFDLQMASVDVQLKWTTTDGSHFDLQAAEGVQKCFSARNCNGRVLSNRDRHNCRVKSRGKSWMDANGNCFNL